MTSIDYENLHTLGRLSGAQMMSLPCTCEIRWQFFSAEVKLRIITKERGELQLNALQRPEIYLFLRRSDSRQATA